MIKDIQLFWTFNYFIHVNSPGTTEGIRHRTKSWFKQKAFFLILL